MNGSRKWDATTRPSGIQTSSTWVWSDSDLQWSRVESAYYSVLLSVNERVDTGAFLPSAVMRVLTEATFPATSQDDSNSEISIEVLALSQSVDRHLAVRQQIAEYDRFRIKETIREVHDDDTCSEAATDYEQARGHLAKVHTQ